MDYNIVMMGTPAALYLRRGGVKYAKYFLSFSHWMRQSGWIGNREFVMSAIPDAAVCVAKFF